MDQQKVDLFIMTNKDYLPEEKILYVKEKLQSLPEEKLSLISTISFKNPTTILLVSIFLGSLGIDRFMVGDTGMGVLKLLTGGVCGILTLVDWFTISKATKEKNFTKLITLM
ncbi:MAG: TM2 domain-containing protein [Ruminococcaceae bacterium]|nr:TM2 domain-containing protein [Oscillospiraceae bacterium]